VVDRELDESPDPNRATIAVVPPTNPQPALLTMACVKTGVMPQPVGNRPTMPTEGDAFEMDMLGSSGSARTTAA
jgi:hypothetical protein